MGDVYRPTVRMDDTFQKYIEAAFHASTLDRNQIVRLMLFTAPLSAVYVGMLREWLHPGIDAPAPIWTRRDTDLWRQQTWENAERSGDVHDLHGTVGMGISVRVGNMGQAAAARGGF